MPLTAKGEKVMTAMRESYPSEEKAKSVFYAMKNAGKLTGVDTAGDCARYMDACRRGDHGAMRAASDQMMRGRIVR